MLFNSYEFLLVFLPVTLLVFYTLTHLRLTTAALIWLTLVSVAFYAWWSLPFTGLLLASITFNFIIGWQIRDWYERPDRKRARKALLWFGVLANLGLLGFFKYANFTAENLMAATGVKFHWSEIALPIGISFYTFHQLPYLIDAYRGQAGRYSPLKYALFVLFFPQLIAGPIVHHREIMPQLDVKGKFLYQHSNLLVGLTFFTLGLFKKVVIADNVAIYSTPVFDAAAVGQDIAFLPAWLAATAFMVQVYFDFSGYSDMAIGLGRLFGIQLPFNFFSPLKANDIIDFWRRWHMTLTRFITSYVFTSMAVPLMRFSVNRRLKGFADMAVTVLVPTFITFILVGLWHGAGWNYVLFGALHGFFIVVNYVWRQFRRGRKLTSAFARGVETGLGKALFLLCLVVSMVLFRSANLTAIEEMYRSMLDWQSLSVLAGAHFAGWLQIAAIFVPLAVALTMPNSQQIVARYRPGLDIYKWQRMRGPPRWWQWRMTGLHAAIVAIVLAGTLLSLSAGSSEFLYFDF